MAPAHLEQSARKKIRLLKKALAECASFCLSLSPNERDIMKVLELSAALEGAISIGPPDTSIVEPWLRAFLEADIPRALLELAMSIGGIAFSAFTPAYDLATLAHTQLVRVWKAAQYLLFEFSLQLAMKPSPPLELGRKFLDHLLPLDHGASSK
jgi:hypothetical protein